MTRKLLLAVVVVVALGSTAPASAQAISIHLGGFVPRAEDARVTNDVLFENLNFLYFDIKEFNGVSLGGEYLFQVGDMLEVGAGVSFYQRSVPSVYADLVNADGSEIAQRMKLRIVPVTGTVRFLPLGNRAAVQPYVGAGLGVLVWRYSETGEFVDYSTYDIFRGNYVVNGTTVGPVLLGGLRIPMGRRVALGFDMRYHSGTADVGNDFYGDKLDLGGMTYSFAMTFKY